nr:putative reverse transcriptase domain-containing protein [Tanacetum cinerariifolium]
MCEPNTGYNWERIAGRGTVVQRGGRTDRGGGGTRGQSVNQGNDGIDGQGGQIGGQGTKMSDGVDRVPNFSIVIAQQLQNLLLTILAQVGNQGSNLGNGRNQNGDAVNDNIRGDVRNVIENDDHKGCTYKEFLACNPKEYNGKGGVIVYTRWIKKIELALAWWNSQIHTRGREAVVGMSWADFKTLTREEFCPVNEMQKLETEFWNHAMVEAGHVAYTDRFHELARLVHHLVTPENKMIERNGSLKKNPEKRGNNRESSRDRNVRDDKKRTRTGNAFATITNPSGPRMVNSVNAKNPTAAPEACYKYGGTDHLKATCGRVFMLGAEDARRDPNIMTDMFTLNNHYDTTLFDYGADYSFVSTTFIPLLGIEPSDLGFSYEIEIASGQLVEIDKVIKGCKLEIEGHMFDINLVTFGSESFDVIIGIDWLSNHKVEIIYHEKVVRIPLPDSKVLRVIGESPEEKIRHVMSAKAKEQKQEEIVVVKDFPEVFPDDLSGLTPIREIKFRIELVPGAISVVKPSYRLAPSVIEEL